MCYLISDAQENKTISGVMLHSMDMFTQYLACLQNHRQLMWNQWLLNHDLVCCFIFVVWIRLVYLLDHQPVCKLHRILSFSEKCSGTLSQLGLVLTSKLDTTCKQQPAMKLKLQRFSSLGPSRIHNKHI